MHSPIRYAWDLQHQYLHEASLERGIKAKLARMLLHYMRMWDQRTASGVDEFIANSHFIGRRINKSYRRQSTVIYPPVDTRQFTLHEAKEDFYLTASRMVPYKKIPLIIEAFAAMPDKRLIVIGTGPEMDKAREVAGPNVTLLGYQSFEVLLHHMQRAKGFVFAAEEDFGIAPIEAQACGTPVIAYGRGGCWKPCAGSTSRSRPACFTRSRRPTRSLPPSRNSKRIAHASPCQLPQQLGTFLRRALRAGNPRFVEARVREARFEGQDLGSAAQPSTPLYPAAVVPIKQA